MVVAVMEAVTVTVKHVAYNVTFFLCRGRGCNESFRAAVDRSYEAQDSEDQPGRAMELDSGAEKGIVGGVGIWCKL